MTSLIEWTQAMMRCRPTGVLCVSFSADIFAPNELITLWYNTPDGRVVASEIKSGYVIDADSTDAAEQGADYASANTDGVVSVRMSTRGLRPGRYSLVARGNTGSTIAVGAFEVK